MDSGDLEQVYPVEEDTILLLEAAEEEVRPGDRVLEVGTGSGTIAAALTGPAAVIATDINPYAAAAARALGLDVVRADLCSGLRGEFDLVIFNPPYLPTQDEERIDDWLERALDGGESGRDVIERFAASVGGVLADGGRVLMVISSLTGPVEVARIFLRVGFSTRVVRKRAVEGGEELMVLRCVRTAAVPQRSLGGMVPSRRTGEDSSDR